MQHTQGEALYRLFFIKLFFFKMSNTNEDCQPISWLILNFLRELLLQTCHLHNKTQLLTILYKVILLLNVHSVQCVFVFMN